MDVIDRAVEKKLNISNHARLNVQTWEDFEAGKSGKKVFLFGAGACAKIYFEYCKGKTLALDGVVDNDRLKWGKRIDDVVVESFRSGKGDMKILAPSVLGQYRAEEIVVLIASTKYYEEIALELENIGIKCYFVLLIMEANRRKAQGVDERIQPDFDSVRRKYVEECCQEKIENKKVVFYSFGTYSDHGKYISEQLLKIRSDLDIVWLVNDTSVKPPVGVRFIQNQNWMKYIYEMETAKLWVFNIEVPEYIVKRPEQIYVEAKHWAGVTLKKCYLDSATLRKVPEYDNWKRNGKMMDYIFTGSKFDSEFCRRAFGFEKEVVEIGSPRSDALFSVIENREKVCAYYNIDIKTRLLLYAPTFRFYKGVHKLKAPEMELDFEKLKEALEKRWGGEWRILLRLHPNVAKESKDIKIPSYVVDVSEYSDSQELVAASDVVISDYSSIMFEPAFVKKPVFLFATDRETYIDKEYDLLIDYDTLPFLIAGSNDELTENIRNFNQGIYEKILDHFLKKYGVCEDGYASERAATFISKLIDESF